MDFKIPSVPFLVACYAGGAVVICAGAAMMKSRFRVESTMSWLGLALLGPLPALAAKSVVGFFGLPDDSALPTMALAVFLSTILIHWILPAVLPDFQTDSFSASLFMALIVGLVVVAAGMATGEFPGGLIGSMTDAFGGNSVTPKDSLEF